MLIVYNCVYIVDNRAAVLRVFITNLQLLQDACNEAEQVSVMKGLGDIMFNDYCTGVCCDVYNLLQIA